MATTSLQVLQNSSEQQINAVNTWMRGQPWYQQLLQSWGEDPGHPHNLTNAQKATIVRTAQANGVVVDEGHMQIDDNGNFNQKGGSLVKDILIGAGIGGLALTGLGAAGIGPLSGLLGGVPAAATGGELGAVGTTGATTALPAGIGLGEAAATTGLTGPLAGLPTYAALGTTAGPLASTAIGGGILPMTTLPKGGTSMAGTAAGGGFSLGSGGGGGGGGGSTTSSLLTSLLGPIIGAGASLAGTSIAAGASTEAAKIQAAETDKALAQAQQIWQQKQANLAPYMNLGAGAVGNLAYGLGITPVKTALAGTTPSSTTAPTTTTQGGQALPARTQPAGAPTLGTAVSRTSLSPPAAAGYVRVSDPQGNVSTIPVGNLTAAIQAGYRQV